MTSPTPPMPMDPCTNPCTRAPTHARPSLPVNPDPNPTPAEEAVSGLHYTGAAHHRDQNSHDLESLRYRSPLFSLAVLLALEKQEIFLILNPRSLTIACF